MAISGWGYSNSASLATNQVGRTFVRFSLPTHPPSATLAPFRDGNTPLVGQAFPTEPVACTVRRGDGHGVERPEFYEMPVE